MDLFEIFKAIVYGVVQGIAEFLPISSTAHLKIIPWLFGWADPGTSFDVALHLGTAAAVILFFYKDWIVLIRDGFSKPKSTKGKLFWLLVISTIPGGIAGILLSDWADSISKNFLLVGTVLILMGILLYLADIWGSKQVTLDNIGLKRSVLVGISQIFAIIPGVSRSGITMSAGRLLGIRRESIAKFTFLMSTPLILGDGLYHLKKILLPEAGQPAVQAVPFIVAILTSAVVGILSIKFLMQYIKTKSFRIFTVYRIALGVFVIAMALIRG